MKRIYKYLTGAEVPKGAVYLATIKNGVMNPKHPDYDYVWHYFLVEVAE